MKMFIFNISAFIFLRVLNLFKMENIAFFAGVVVVLIIFSENKSLVLLQTSKPITINQQFSFISNAKDYD